MTVWEELQNSIESAPQDGVGEVLAIEYLIKRLISEQQAGSTRDQFEDLCRLSLRAYENFEPTHLGNPQILQNSTAAPLLHYLLLAMHRYLKEVDTIMNTTDARRTLAEAFGINGEQKRPVSFEQKAINAVFAFSQVIENNPITSETYKLAEAEAYRSFFGHRMRTGEGEGSRNLKKIRAILKEHGYMPWS